MSFTSLIFVFCFLPVSLLLYYATRGNKLVLILVSLFFYAGSDPAHFLLLLLLSFATVFLCFGIESALGSGTKRTARLLLVFGAALNVLVLLFFKDFLFFRAAFSRLTGLELSAESLLFPLGLSFYTFKAISLLADTYREKIALRGSVGNGLLYLTFFAHIQSGPILRYNDMLAEPAEPLLSLDSLSAGIERFAVGFSKKVLLADTLSRIVSEVYGKAPSELTAAYAWLGAVCFSLQLYYDFSGYSDMAIGISNMFGYRCPENFSHPYMTRSISDFWRRWHITLGFWFRDYVYIPMGGSRVSTPRLYLNLFVVWLLTGIWHGTSWNFIAWGLGYFVLIAAEKTLRLPERLRAKPLKAAYRILCLLIINAQWVLFRAPGLRYGLSFLYSMLGRYRDKLTDLRALFLLRDNLVFFLAAVVLCFPVRSALEGLCSRFRGGSKLCSVLVSAVVILCFLASVTFLVSGSNNPFMYANF